MVRMKRPDKARWDEIMTRRYARWVAVTLLLASGCGDSPTPETPVAKPDSTSLAIIDYNKGNKFLDKEDWDTAIASYSDAIRLKPDYAKAYNNRGVAYDKKGESDAAIKDCSEAILLKPDYAEAYYNRGNAYGKKGDKTKAAADFAKAKELEAK